MAFSTNGEYMVSSHESDARVWRVEDGKQVATLSTGSGWCCCLAVSNDGKWIAAGTWSHWDALSVWDATTYKQVSKHDIRYISAVDFSPDSKRLVSALHYDEVIVWDIASNNQAQTLHHENVFAAKYSPTGDRIATASQKSVRVWDSNDCRLLIDIKVDVIPVHNAGLVWFNNHFFVVSKNTIKQFDAPTGSAVAEWPVLRNDLSCIALPKHGKFIAHFTMDTITLWDTSTHAQLGLIQSPRDIRSIEFSPDDQSLAFGGPDGIISIIRVSRIINSIPSVPLSRPHPTLQEPDIHIDDAVLHAWKHDQLENAEALLTAAISESPNPAHPIFASRALMRARLRRWDAALEDAEKALDIQPSVIAFLAKSVAHVGKGEKDKAYRACDIAFEHFHSSHVTFLLLIKAIIVFMAGEHPDAISRVDDLIATVSFNSICYVVQAYMYLLLGNSQMECGDHDGAIQSFERAQAQMRDYPGPPFSAISLITGWKFDNLGITIGQQLCEALYAAGRTNDAAKCFHDLKTELGGHDDHLEWAYAFGQHSKKLERLGDTATDALRHDEAISHYTTALHLVSSSPRAILIKRSKVLLATGSWKQALDDVNEVIALDPSSPWGYEIKHAALHKGGDYDNATVAFETMLTKLAESPDPDVQRHGDQYISPSSTRATIRKIVHRTLRHSPRVLINTTTGHLHNRAEQASAFESLPIFKELVSSTTTRIDYVRIKREVREHFRYVMLSHKWEDNEPLFQKVVHIAVYDLEESPTHDKLQTFCKIVRDAAFDWAWSDTCCIDKSDHFVLQEALVAMFKWYQGSAMMIVFLRGVRSSSQRGALVRSIWNTRAWTLQEYVASKVIHFYTEDWTPYLDLQLPNHKESPEIIAEMEHATGVSAQQLMALRPGLTSIREKLCLASTRETTLVEDAAYSLLGIFSVTGIPAIYGEGEGSLGRLLAHILAGSGDASILAWTGESGSFNSCLPAHITVFSGPATLHIPPSISDAEMERHITASHSSSFDLDSALRLYERLNDLSPPWFAASRMKLPCIAFQLPPLTPYRTRSGRVYRADTVTFGMVEIKTRQDLSRMKTLYLIHPWLETVLEREDTHGGALIEDDVVPPPSPLTDGEEIDDEEIDDDVSSFAEPQLSPHPAPIRMPSMSKETRARRLVTRLRQPFGALLVTLASTGRRTMDYRRVAADNLITVQLQDSVELADILDNVRVLDVL
ncbi:hypothetical protein L210DRAFT_3547707 [Boletus edulis BED1]|uniref:Heterokaryon incompatibility domain-containing protein n=1 Tax=Boletus edulis BED1 TaxID=1328754 RepID=A0AAD4BPL2_BOLED|nr:hypothetical protein L210DRAFT_3547707 [Boletus edulis BED1]